jgi:uncharacterized LabA/DUF88 family protein
MPKEPPEKRAICFIDGQNLFHSVRESFGYTYPNYDVPALSKAICDKFGWILSQIRFYTGVPEPSDNIYWHHFWSAKMAVMGRQGVFVYSRTLRYRNKTIKLADGKQHSFLTGEEKGIDVRLALDILRLAYRQYYDVAVIFSQDQDLSEVSDEIRIIAKEQKRWIKVVCPFPFSPTSKNLRGINKTDWIKIDRKTYDSCIDYRDYRLKKDNS